MRAIVKVSDVDWKRLFNQTLIDPSVAATHFLDTGAHAVCVTLGDKGCLVASKNVSHFLPARLVEVKDTTGAGDAFWAGFLTAWLDGYNLLNCALAGRRMAELKLGHFGLLPLRVERELIFDGMIV
jgi:fructokinase